MSYRFLPKALAMKARALKAWPARKPRIKLADTHLPKKNRPKPVGKCPLGPDLKEIHKYFSQLAANLNGWHPCPNLQLLPTTNY
jgi:hypothetical protein